MSALNGLKIADFSWVGAGPRATKDLADNGATVIKIESRKRLGLGYDALRQIKPDIILASVSVAGRTGPMAGFRGYGNSAAAHSGHAALTGWPGGDPHMPPLAYGDVVAPMFATVAILAALEHKARTGEGQHLDISQIEPMVHVIADLYALDTYALHGVFPTRGEDEWIAIAACAGAELDRLAELLGLEPENVTGETVAARTLAFDRFELADRLAAAGIAAAAVQDGRDVARSEELAAGRHIVSTDHPVLGKAAMPAPPYTMDQTPWSIGKAPLLGEHNGAVLVDMLGMTRADVEALEAQGVLA